MSHEEWRTVTRDSLYEVSNQGRVRSIDRVITTPSGVSRSSRGKVLKPVLDSDGYGSVVLSGQRRASVHTLVLEAFVGPKPQGQEGRHLDDIPANNWATNLAWGTRSDNMRDCIRNGHHNMLKRVACPLEHVLAPPNLIASCLRQGSRACLACSRARAAVRNALTRKGIALDFAAEASRHYERIMQ